MIDRVPTVPRSSLERLLADSTADDFLQFQKALLVDPPEGQEPSPVVA